jgi:pyrimidine operon attenuation protein/uracil phosphoribosyltransferase
MTENNSERVIMTAEDMAASVRQLSRDIVLAHDDPNDIHLLGILSRGRPLADRLASEIDSETGVMPKVGSLSTTLYRDDLRSGKVTLKAGGGETHFDFDVNGQSVVLVDDVLNSGRTVRAALDEVMDYGRPSKIQLACLIDRGLREVPIQADYLGLSIQTDPQDHVHVRITEIDGEDAVVLSKAP